MHALVRVGSVILLAIACTGRVAAQGEVQRQHDADIRTFNNNIDRYHNNADDYPKPAEPAHKTDMSPNYVPVLSRPAKQPEAYVESPAQRHIIGLQQHVLESPAAELELADCYFYGRDIAQDKDLAYLYYSSAGSSLPHATYLAAKMLFLGDGIGSDPFQAYGMMNSAARRGDPDAIAFLKLNPEPKRSIGEFPSMLAYADEQFRAAGVNVKPVQPTFAAKVVASVVPIYFKDANKHANAQDALTVGNALLWGAGVPVDLVNADKLLTFASQKRLPGAAESYAWVNFAQRKSPFVLSTMFSALDGQPYTASVTYLWALYYASKGNPSLQRDWLHASGLHGNMQALTDYAIMEWEGNGGNPDDASGFKDLTTAAATNRNAQYLLGQAYVNGLHGVPTDIPKAIQLFRAAAAQGQIEAKHMLAAAYYQGVTVPKDDSAALKWALDPAEAGLPKDQRLLALLLQSGQGIPHDPARSIEWMKKAAANGDTIAKAELAQGFDGK